MYEIKVEKIDENIEETLLTLVLRYSPAKQKTKASTVTARHGMTNCISIPDLLSIFIPRDYV